MTGRAISGPLTGRTLTPVLHDEVTFGLWRAEHPGTRVLGLDAQASQIAATWEDSTAKARVVTPVGADGPLPPRTLVIGVVMGGASRAYKRETLAGSRVILDDPGGAPIAIVDADDRHSVRVFSRRLTDRTVDLALKVDATPARYIDAETGSEFDFSGRAVSGPLAGQQLTRVPHLSDYWFDWHEYHPDTTVHAPWQPRAARR
ncbi:MAG: DUF3179 domain-containing protein [Acidobacteria bacterium]|nr:DUF3179 domain-containing protein [Acidobacteriota bacterium]